MALRYQAKGVVGTTAAATVVTHGLGQVPDEWFVNHRTAGGVANVTTIGATFASIAVTTAGDTFDFFCAVNHSIIK